MIYLAIGAILIAFAFDFVNGFHDTANAVTTVIYTKALKPRTAIAMSAVMNMAGALLVGTGVAKVIAAEVLHPNVLVGHDALIIVVSGLLGAVGWDLITWYYGLPISSSHALIGGLMGAGMAHAWVGAIRWETLGEKILLPLLVSPVVGIFVGILWMWMSALFVRLLRNFFSVRKISRGFRVMQIMSSAAVSFSHGSNDAQKTMGIITMILAVQFYHVPTAKLDVPIWVILCCGAAMASGTALGGWRIIRTVGEQIGNHRLTWMQGFSAESATASVILLGTMGHFPVSTTHVLSSAVVGTNFYHGAASINLRVVRNIAMAWIYTLPISAAIGVIAYFAIYGIRYLTTAIGI